MWNMDEIYFLVHWGVVFIVYLLISIMLVFFLSPFTDAFFTGYQQIRTGTTVDTYTQYYVPLYAQALKIVFALALAIPMTWAIFWVFSREPTVYKRRVI